MPTDTGIEGYAGECDRSPGGVAPANLAPRELAELRDLHSWLKTIFLSTLGTRDGN